MGANIPSKSEGPIPKHCQVIKLFTSEGPGDFDICPQDHQLVRTNISTKLRVLTISIAELEAFLVLKVMVTLSFDLKVMYFSGPFSLLV